MKKSPFSILSYSLWLTFIIITTLTFLATAIITASITLFLFHFGFLNSREGFPFFPIVFLFLGSAMLGIIISLFLGRKILTPITKLSQGFQEIAKGNFKVQLEETSDVREIKEMSHNFNRMVQELDNIETLRTDFVTSVSHEFKTPLAAIEGYATLLQEQQLAEAERFDYTKMIIESTKQLSTLTGNILLLSKLENQNDIPDKKRFRLDEQIRESILLLENNWSEKEIEMDIDLQKLYYVGSQSLLRQVWSNLLDNAIKFTGKGGLIEVSMICGNDYVCVNIRDSGRGMEENELLHIFDRFYQGDSARKDHGNGLGLALVKRIVSMCEGEITVTSEKEKGSIFSVTLPM